MAIEYKLSYTASEINEKLGKIDSLAEKSEIPIVPDWAKDDTKPTYTASEVGALPSTTLIPTKTSQLTNDNGYLTKVPDEIYEHLNTIDEFVRAFGPVVEDLVGEDISLDEEGVLTSPSVREIATDEATKVKNDLLNGAGGAYDTLKELGDLIDDNADAINALETVASSKVPNTRTINGKALTNDITLALSDLKADSTHRTVTDAEKAAWNAKANTSDIREQISQLSSEIVDKTPDYVIEEAEATIAKVFTHSNLGRTIRFIAISDTHEDSTESYNSQITVSNKHAGQAIKYIADRIGIDFVAHLGDASSCGAFVGAYDFDALHDDVKNINKFIFSGVRGIKAVFIPGNHDMIDVNGQSLLNSGAFPLFGNMCSGNKDRLGGWGYFDIEDAKVRVIYLNTSDSPNSAAYLALTQTQKNWLCETLIDVNTKDRADEWKMIILSHAPLDFKGANISTDILLPYVNGESYNTYNFADKNNAKIISNIHGHVHCFSYGYIEDKIRRFCVPNACFIGANHYASRTEYADWVDTTTYNKTANSGKDTAFSLVTIDLDNGMCYVDNYGAGLDREFSTDYNANSEPKILLNLNRTYVSGAIEESMGNYLNESKALLNAAYTGTQDFASKSCAATGITENSVTVTEAGIGGICVAYPIHLTDIGTQAYRITFDYSGVGKCRSYYKYVKADGSITTNHTLYADETAGTSGSASAIIPASSGYEWLIIYFSSNTGNTKTFTNVSLTKA